MNQLGYVMGQQTVQILQDSKDTTFTLLDREWEQLGVVFGGDFMHATAFFTAALPLRAGTGFLEMGCGSGITAVTAALHGCTPVVAVDVNPAAADNVRRNAELHGVGDRVTPVTSYLFRELDPGQRFDTIYWNSNFIEGPAETGEQSYVEAAVFDPGYRAHEEFLTQAPRFLADRGSIFLGFSELVGNRRRLEEFADAAGLSTAVYRQQTFDVPYEQMGAGPEFAAHADADGMLHPDFTLLEFRRR
ncbi:50S ribosomal protein L11 methyltransferase [Actinoplanes siamensis]|uniref:Methyltransferase n=1 Tax=Actinoplanes siamensis TaxID=1223317 RepID=A0A919N9I0_9ACTN|nr:50S ribosomal protein L11 methyltransferase [Actinoplanes siamensis]GIF07024.1 hypothetical protein Asi03nite_45620 [Actinoplanes siamensis]